MSKGLLFWVMMLLWLIFGIYTGVSSSYIVLGGNLLEFLLFAVLGWAVFGPPIKG